MMPTPRTTIKQLHERCLRTGCSINIHHGKLCGFITEEYWI